MEASELVLVGSRAQPGWVSGRLLRCVID
jgi:hypothetical protein